MSNQFSKHIISIQFKITKFNFSDILHLCLVFKIEKFDFFFFNAD